MHESDSHVQLAGHPTGVRLGQAVGCRSRPKRSSSCAARDGLRSRHALDPTGQDEVLPPVAIGSLEASATPGRSAAHGIGVAEHVDAGDGGAPGVRAGQAAEDLDGGGLTGAVRAEQREDRAGPDGRTARPTHGSGLRVRSVGLDEIVGRRAGSGYSDMNSLGVGAEAAAPIVECAS